MPSKKVTRLVLTIGCLCCLSFLDASIFEVYDLSDFQKEINRLDQSAFVLFDVDYTLLTPKDGALKPEGKRIRQLCFHGLTLRQQEYFQSIIYLEAEEELVDSRFPQIIQQIQNQKIRTIGFTALNTGKYGKIEKIEDWRLTQLKKLGVDFSCALSDKTLLFFDKKSYSKGRRPLFKNGVLFSDQLAKGELILDFLEKIDWKPTKVVFIDDSLYQLKSVEFALKSVNIEFVGFHYQSHSLKQKKLDQKLAKRQFATLIQKEKWVSDL